MISFKRELKLAVAMMIISMSSINICAIEQEQHSRIIPNNVMPHSEAESSNGVAAKISNTCIVDKTVVQANEQSDKEKSISSENNNKKVDNVKKNVPKNKISEPDLSQKNTKEKSDETKLNKCDKNQANTIPSNNTKKNNNTKINKEVSSVAALNDSEQIDSNLEDQEEIHQEHGSNLSGGFDFIKSNKTQNNWIGDGKILLYIGILFISISVLGISIILIPKRKKKFKNFLF